MVENGGGVEGRWTVRSTKSRRKYEFEDVGVTSTAASWKMAERR